MDAVWLATEPVDMRAGADRLLAAVVQIFGPAQAHHDYMFANTRGTLIKLRVHDRFGVWCAARRQNQGAQPGAHSVAGGRLVGFLDAECHRRVNTPHRIG